jgi:hypothetical protein
VTLVLGILGKFILGGLMSAASSPKLRDDHFFGQISLTFDLFYFKRKRMEKKRNKQKNEGINRKEKLHQRRIKKTL